MSRTGSEQADRIVRRRACERQLSSDERASLEQALTITAARTEARANPLLEDLDDSEPDAALRAWLDRAPTFVRFARAATRSPVCAPDGFCVRPRTSAVCSPGWSAPAGDAETARARFIAWTWGHALRFRAPTEVEARRAAEQLRIWARSSERIALVLVADDASAVLEPPYAELQRLWLQANKHGSTLPTEPVTIDPRDVVVFPRLAAIADDIGLAAEVRACTHSLE